jgi:CheY-like chemotaxis protein
MPERRRILIVEDDDDISSSMTELLEEEGYAVTRAANGVEALSRLRSGGELPQLVLLDLMMPLMDGYEFRETQRRDPKLSGIPIVLMSAGGDLKANAVELGVRGVLRKPFLDIGTVLETIDSSFDG